MSYNHEAEYNNLIALSVIPKTLYADVIYMDDP